MAYVKPTFGAATTPRPGGYPQPPYAPEPGDPRRSPRPPYPDTEGPTQRPPAPRGGGVCPPGTPAGPASCCPAGTVWRTDTNRCEEPDARSKAGKETCPEPSPGPQYWCDFDTGTWKFDPSAPGGPGAGGVGGGGAGGRPAPFVMPLDPAAAESGQIWQAILKRLQGPSRYTPEVMAALLGQTKTTAEAQAARQAAEANADFSARGILRSPLAAEAQRGIRSDVYSQVLNQQNVIARAKIDADYADKTQAIKEGLDWLNSLRDYIARMTATQASKDVGMANVNLGIMQLQQQLAMLRERYVQELNLAIIGRGSA